MLSDGEPYSREDLVRRISDGWQPKFLFFWGQTGANPASTVGRECLSQWFPADFVLDGIKFPTAEHYMMYRKARLFGDEPATERILSARHPGDAKRMGRTVRNFDEVVWEKNRCDIVIAGNTAKFSQHEALHSFLLGTARRVLVEASPRDAVWGIGLAESHSSARHPSEWRGLNLLGFALMRVRHALPRPARRTTVEAG